MYYIKDISTGKVYTKPMSQRTSRKAAAFMLDIVAYPGQLRVVKAHYDRHGHLHMLDVASVTEWASA